MEKNFVFIFDLDETLVDWSYQPPKLFPQAIAILENLKHQGYCIALASYNKSAVSVLQSFDISKYFDVVEFENLDDNQNIVTRDVIGLEIEQRYKYRGLACDNKYDMLKAIMCKFNLPRNQYIFLDDHQCNVRTANKLGMYGIHIGFGGVEWKHIWKAINYFEKIKK